MAVEVHTTGDFDAILDASEALTLDRRGASETIAIPGARRFSTHTSAVDDTGGHAAAHDAVWQFSWEEAVDLPRLGDRLIDAHGRCWTILVVAQLAGNTRLRCLARDLEIFHGLDSWVHIEVAVWDDLGGGPEIVGWQTLRPNVRARVQPISTTVDHEADPPTSVATYRVTLGEQLELDHNHRLIGPDGTIYQVVEFSQAERIDALPMAVVVRVDGE